MLKQLALFLSCAIYISIAAQPTTYTYKTVGDLAIELDVYVPNATNYTKYPVVFCTHGGGYVFETMLDALSDQELDEMLSRGWVVVTIDYRLAPGTFLEDIIQDVEDAYNWVRTELVNITPINPDNIALWGGSAGGGLAAIGGFRLTPRPKVVISLYPYCTNFTDLYFYNPNTLVNASLVAEANGFRQVISEYNSTGITDPRRGLFFDALDQGKSGWLVTTANPDESPDQILAILKNYSVVYNIDAHYPPTYLIHGLADTIVPYQQSIEMATVLQNNNVTYRLELVPGADHEFDFLNLSSYYWQENVLPAIDFAQKYLIDHHIKDTVIA